MHAYTYTRVAVLHTTFCMPRWPSNTLKIKIKIKIKIKTSKELFTPEVTVTPGMQYPHPSMTHLCMIAYLSEYIRQYLSDQNTICLARILGSLPFS